MNLSLVQKTNALLILLVAEKFGVTDHKQLAYILATAMHESGLVPIKEKEDKKRGKVWAWQSKYWNTGYYGRGFVQLTWKANYQKFSDLLGIDLVSNPDLVLEPIYAAFIIVKGMRDGNFTGRKLADFTYTYNPNLDVDNSTQSLYAARTMINGYVEDQAENVKKCYDYFIKVVPEWLSLLNKK